jgi:hypothetical protein
MADNPNLPGEITPGADLIAAERRRQVEAEGWTPEHDDEHDDSALLNAARSYELCAAFQLLQHDPEHAESVLVRRAMDVPPIWPWHPSWWKPSDDPVRNLVKAGALIAAEIDRIQRQRGTL